MLKYNLAKAKHRKLRYKKNKITNNTLLSEVNNLKTIDFLKIKKKKNYNTTVTI